MMRSPTLAKPSRAANLPARTAMSSMSCASLVTTAWTPQARARRPAVSGVWRQSENGGRRPLAGDAKSGRTGRRPGDDRLQIKRFGDIARGDGDGVGSGGFGRRPLRVDDAAIISVALDLLGDLVHRRNGLDRILPGGAFPPTASRRRRLQRPRWRRRILPRALGLARLSSIQHLRRDDDRLAPACQDGARCG